MAGLNKTEQAKKPGKSKALHNEPVHELPKAVDWDEQERIKASLKGKYLEPITHQDRSKARRDVAYSPEKGAEMCILRRSGMSMRQVCEEVKTTSKSISMWLFDYPEFSQEWEDAYKSYITDIAEELVPRAEALMQGLRLDGRKLSVKQEKRYLKAMEILSSEARWAAARRVPNLYGDASDGGELVLVQPLELERNVSQDVNRAVEWKKQVQESLAETSLQDPGEGDGDGGDDRGEDGDGGDSEPPVSSGDSGTQDERGDT